MKKFIFLALVMLIFFTSQAQQVAIFVYSNSSIPTNALRSQLTQSFLEGKNSTYSVVDRTDEILNLLTQEYGYQGSGMVRDDQLVSLGAHLGATYICAVSATYYPQYNQYFFEGKLVGVQTRQVVKSSMYPSSNDSPISDMDPMTQMKVGKALAMQLDLYSTEEKKYYEHQQYQAQQNLAAAQRRAEEEAKVYKVGDLLKSSSQFVNGARIGYVDGTGKHGIAYKILSLQTKEPDSYAGSYGAKIPTRSQMRLLYNNKYTLGLNGEYWTKEEAGKDKHYTFNFDTGTINARKSGLGSHPYYQNIYIYEF